jgi:hypothetical protein
MVSTSGSISNQGHSGSSLVSMQLSFSTADVENFVFYGSSKPMTTSPLEPASDVSASPEGAEPVYRALVVNGELYQLDESGELPGMQATAPGQEAAIFRIVGLDQQTRHAG